MTYDHVVYEKRGHVAYVTLNRPERMNALDAQSHAELIEVFDDFAADDGAWVAIVTGAGDRAFCAGNDLKATADASARGERRVDPGARFGAITRGYRCPKPLIAAVNGVAAGGGFEIALACDIVVAADVPYNVAVVETDEGVRLTAQVVDCPNEALAIGMALDVTFERLSDEVAIPKFRPRP